ncbi:MULTISPECIES: AIM24 family protein [Halobacterium]|uniref:AIM24 family protein n=1 Tax=Halobacterium TaxID=2239 RepID=UPI00073E37A2|nr:MULTISPECIES: AIM24 family protein [Halobacterium]MCG1002459.1 AIM24 family protein [Halobacterium noricense]
MDISTLPQAADTDTDTDGFRKENNRLLGIPVDGSVTIRAGSMVGYTGEFTFTGKASAEGGLTGLVKEAVTSEGTPVMVAEGTGYLYVADRSKKVQILDLDADESLSVNGNDVLAFDANVDYEISTIGNLSGAAAGGLTNVYLTGPGEVAITTHGDPLVINPPVTTDPDATVAWSDGLSPSFSVNKALEIGQTSGESVQMEFSADDGFVVLQPHEEGGQMQ